MELVYTDSIYFYAALSLIFLCVFGLTFATLAAMVSDQQQVEDN